MSNAIALKEEIPFKEQIKAALESGFLPQGIKTVSQAMVIAVKGRELGIPPMQSFSQINIIQGKPCISAELMLALIYKNCPRAVIVYRVTDNSKCAITAARDKDQAQSTFSFTIEDAKLAGVLGKDNWKKYPAAMLRARCVSAMARAVFPDAIMGCYTPEEMGAVVNEEGQVLEVKENAAPPLQINRFPKSADFGKDAEVDLPDSKEEEHHEDLSTFVFTYGKFKDRAMGTIPLEELEDYYHYWTVTNKSRLTGAAAEALTLIKTYIDEQRAKEMGDLPY